MASYPAEDWLAAAIGSPITRVRRVHYVYRGVPDTDFGPLELTFGRDTILLDGAADGETLRVCTTKWEDPFAGPLSDQNEAFVERAGKWTAFDVSGAGALATLIGDVLASVEPVLGESGNVTGMILRTGRGGVIRVDVEADELFLNQVIPAGPAENRQ